MNNTERIIGRLPSYYQAHKKTSNLYRFIDAIGKSIEIAEGDINRILLSRWLSTADKDDLERLGNFFGINLPESEGPEDCRKRIVVTVNDLVNGRGTSASIRRLIKTNTGIDPEIVENPIVEADLSSIFLKTGDHWDVFCNSVIDSDPILRIRVLNHLYNPTFTNLTNNESVTYNGLLRKGSTLTIYPDGNASLTGIDVSDRVEIRSNDISLKLPKGRSVWVYTDDTAKFNENDSGGCDRVIIELKMKWTEREPASVVVKVPGDPGDDESEIIIQDLLEQVRTAGVKFKIENVDNEE